jgi:hypothetical protein
MAQAPCTCEDRCPDCQTCMVWMILEEGVCHGHCTGCTAEAPRSLDEVARRFPLDSLVDVEMRGVPLGEAARLLAQGSAAEIFVPAHRLDERRDLYLKAVSLDTVLRELGLMAVSSET